MLRGTLFFCWQESCQQKMINKICIYRLYLSVFTVQLSASISTSLICLASIRMSPQISPLLRTTQNVTLTGWNWHTLYRCKSAGADFMAAWNGSVKCIFGMGSGTITMIDHLIKKINLFLLKGKWQWWQNVLKTLIYFNVSQAWNITDETTQSSLSYKETFNTEKGGKNYRYYLWNSKNQKCITMLQYFSSLCVFLCFIFHCQLKWDVALSLSLSGSHHHISIPEWSSSHHPTQSCR